MSPRGLARLKAALRHTKARQRGESGDPLQRLAFRDGEAHALIAGVQVTALMRPDPGGWAARGRFVYGRFSDRREPGALPNPPEAPQRWFVPSINAADIADDLLEAKLGRTQAKGFARDVVVGLRRRALAYGRDWTYVTLVIRARRHGRVLERVERGIEHDLSPDSAYASRLAWRWAALLAEQLTGRNAA